MIVSRFLVFVIFGMIDIFDIIDKFINVLIFCMFSIIASHSLLINSNMKHFLRLICLYLRITNIFECLFLKISSKSLFLHIFYSKLAFAFSREFYIEFNQINNHKSGCLTYHFGIEIACLVLIEYYFFSYKLSLCSFIKINT